MTDTGQTAKVAVFDDFRDLPDAVKKHLGVFEDMIGDLDGKTLAMMTGDSTFIDDGTIVAGDYVEAFNGIVTAHRASLSREAALREALSECKEFLDDEDIDLRSRVTNCQLRIELAIAN